MSKSKTSKLEIDGDGLANYWRATGQEILAYTWYALRDGHIGLDEANELAGQELWEVKEKA